MPLPKSIPDVEAAWGRDNSKHQSEGLQMANQRAIMFMVGQDDAQRVYLETRDRGWIDSNNQNIRALGQAIIK